MWNETRLRLIEHGVDPERLPEEWEPEINLSWTVLTGANLSWTVLTGAVPGGADLSGADGLLSQVAWMDGLERSMDGYVVYKRIGRTQCDAPESWAIEPGSIIEEVPNPDRCTECGCGVNSGTREWCEHNYIESDLWRCLIRREWAAGVIVPYGTDGKARCDRLQLLEIVEEER